MSKKGLSLIELLGVLVVITFIFLITVVEIKNINKNTALTSYKVSAKNYAKSVESYMGDIYIKKGKLPYGKYSVDGKTLSTGNPLLEPIELSVKGDTPKNGIICVNKDGEVLRYTLQFDKYVVSKKNNKQTIKKSMELDEIVCDNDENFAAALTMNASPAGWARSKSVTIDDNYDTGIQIQYKVGRKGKWTNYDGAFDVTTSGTVYARLFDGDVELANSSHYLTQLDVEPPKVRVTGIERNYDNIVINFDSSDNFEIVETTCLYGTGGNYNLTGTVSGNKCTLSDLTESTTYNYKIIVKDIVDFETEAVGTTSTKGPICFASAGSGYTVIPEQAEYIYVSAYNTYKMEVEWYNCDGMTYDGATARAPAYLEIYDENNTKIYTTSFLASGNGQVVSRKVDLPEGAYRIRMYGSSDSDSNEMDCYAGYVTASTTSSISGQFCYIEK